jgi:hypothetical protein
VAEGTWSVLAPALEPGHHTVVGQHGGDGRRQVGRPFVGHLGRAQPGGQLVVRPAPAQRRASHGLHAVAQAPGHLQGGTQGGAGVAGGGLDPEALEGSLLGQPGVRHAVEGHASGHGQVAIAGLAVEPAGQVEQDLLEADLHAAGQIGVLGLERVRASTSLGQGGQLEGLDDEAAVTRGPYGVAQQGERRGPAIGRQGHDLVLVRGPPEAQVLRHLLVQQPQRMGQLLGGQNLEGAVDGPAGQVGGSLAPPVEDEDARRGVGRGEMGGRGMGDVVGHEAHARRIEAGKRRLEERRGPPGIEGAQTLPALGGDVLPYGRGEGGVVGVRHRVEVSGGEAALGQAPGRGLDG